MVGPGRIDVVGPFPGSEPAGELLGVMVTDGSSELQPLHLVPVPERVAADPVAMEELRRATAGAAELQHLNILRTFGIEEVQGKAMRVVAWVEAHPLRAIVQVGDRLPPQIAARILVDVCRAAQHVLNRSAEGGRVAGALSLDTVLVAASGVTLVTGFSAPTLFQPSGDQPGPGGGTITDEVTRPAIEDDVRALGILLYALLSGDLPLAEQPGAGAGVPNEPPPLSQLGITGPLAEIATRALSPEASTRFRSPGALAEEIARVSGDLVQPPAVATYIDLLFPPEEGDRAARRVAIETAVAKYRLAASGKAKPERKLSQERSVELEQKPPQERPVPAADEAVAPPVPTATSVEAQRPEDRAPLVDHPAGRQPSSVVDLVSTTDIVLEPGPPPAAPDLVSTTDIVLEPAHPPAAPDLVSTADIVAEPPQIPPEPDLVGTADIVADAIHPPARPDLITTEDIVPEIARPLPPSPSPVARYDQDQTPPVARPAFRPATPISAPIPRRLGAVWAGVILAPLVLGFCLSYFLGWGVFDSGAHNGPGTSAPAGTATDRPQAAPPPAVATGPSPTAPSPPKAQPPVPAPVSAPAPPARPPSGKAMLIVSADPAGSIFIDGKLAGRSPLTKPVSRGQHKVRLRDAEQGIDVTRTVEVKGSESRVRFTIGTGRLTVTAPEGAAIFVDGRRVGTSEVRDLPIWEGEHKLLVTLGQAKDAHVFQLRAGGNYSYEVARTAEP